MRRILILFLIFVAVAAKTFFEDHRLPAVTDEDDDDAELLIKSFRKCLTSQYFDFYTASCRDCTVCPKGRFPINSCTTFDNTECASCANKALSDTRAYRANCRSLPSLNQPYSIRDGMKGPIPADTPWKLVDQSKINSMDSIVDEEDYNDIYEDEDEDFDSVPLRKNSDMEPIAKRPKIPLPDLDDMVPMNSRSGSFKSIETAVDISNEDSSDESSEPEASYNLHKIRVPILDPRDDDDDDEAIVVMSRPRSPTAVKPIDLKSLKMSDSSSDSDESSDDSSQLDSSSEENDSDEDTQDDVNANSKTAFAKMKERLFAMSLTSKFFIFVAYCLAIAFLIIVFRCVQNMRKQRTFNVKPLVLTPEQHHDLIRTVHDLKNKRRGLYKYAPLEEFV